jgi:hypothetical protein
MAVDVAAGCGWGPQFQAQRVLNGGSWVLLRPQGWQGMSVVGMCVCNYGYGQEADEGDDTPPDVKNVDPMTKALLARTWTSLAGDQGQP